MRIIDADEMKNHLYRAQAEAFKRSDFLCASAFQIFINFLDKQPSVDKIIDDEKAVGTEEEENAHDRQRQVPESNL